MTLSVNQNGSFKEIGYGCQDLEDAFALMGLVRYGTQDYLPAGVAGSFEGAARRVSSRVVPMTVEDDGTLVMLRNATNGLRDGVYYSYVGLTDAGEMQAYRPTNTRYLPKFLPNHTPVTIGRGNDGVFLGYANNNSDSSSALFVALTSGTFNQDLHVGAVLTGINPDPVHCSPVISGDALYILVRDATLGLAFAVWSAPLASIRSNDTVALTQVTGWTTVRGWSSNVTGNAQIYFAEGASSLNNAGKASYLSQPNNLTVDNVYQSGIDFELAADGNGKIRVLYGAEHYVVASDQTSSRSYWRLSFVVDPVAKTATPDAGVSLPLRPSYANGVVSFPGALYTLRSDFDASPLGNYYVSTAYSLVRQRMYTYATPNSGPASLYSATLDKAYSRRFDMLLYTRRTLNPAGQQAADAFGSAVGTELRKPQHLPNGNLMVYSLGNSIPGQLTEGYVRAKLGADGFSYATLAGNFTGFAPTVDRAYINESVNGEKLYGISNIAANGTVTYSPAQMGPDRLSCPRFLDEYLNVSGSETMTVTQANLDSVVAAVANGAGLGTLLQFRGTVYIPQNPNIPAIVHVILVTSDKRGFGVVGTCVASARTGNITLSGGTYLNRYQMVAVGQAIESYFSYPSHGMTIYEGTDCWFVSFAGRYRLGYVGNGSSVSWRGVVAKSAPGSFVSGSLVGAMDYHYLNSGNPPFAVPGWGFGYLDGNNSSGRLSGSALLFVPVGKTLADYNAWSAGTTKVLLSQSVAQGWVVYFTESSPLLLQGKAYSLPITNIDLTKVDPSPANKTFYAYVQLVDGVASYVISGTPLTETASRFHIGNITTNASQISAISITKTTMFAGKHLSPSRRGNSIPVSSGNPASGGGTYLW